MKDTIRVLHLFHAYLLTTENWAFRLIDQLPDTEIVIAAKYFRRKMFYRDKFECLEFPLRNTDNPNRLFWLRLVNLIYSISIKFYPWYIQRMCGKCDLVHSHYAVLGWQYMRLAKRLGIPHVVSFYGFDYEYLPYKEPRWVQRYAQLFRNADMFLCEGTNGARILQKKGCPPEKIQIAKLGVNTEKIPFYGRSKTRGELRLLQIASFVEKKGHRYTIEGFTRALRECPNMTLTLVGSDPVGIRGELQKMLRDTAAGDKVTFVDAVDFNELYRSMKDYHVFIHPSCYTDDMNCEGGAPVVLLDAQATGLPIISTTHCDIPEEVLHGKTGLLSPEKDGAALAESISKFYNMGNDEYRLFTVNARKHIEENYNMRLNATRVRKLYADLLSWTDRK